MVTVDVIVDPENLPRIRLLQAHMRDLQVDLRLHEALPSRHSGRLIYVPRQKDSRLQQLPAPAAERIALYLDEDAEQIEADMAVQLYSWPARSSDPHVRTLARHLKRPLAASAPEAEDAAAQPPKAVASERRKNAIALSVMGAVVLVVMLLMELDTAPSDESNETAPEPDRVAVDKLDAAGAAQHNSSNGSLALPPRIEKSQRIEPDTAADVEMMIAEPSVAPPHTRQTIAPCASTNELLRAPLRWRLPTDLEPCAG